MMELRTILRNCDSRTLVLGDELCRGTESDSGTGLTVATLLTLIDKKVSCIFSTHMHHLPDLEWIKSVSETGQLRICHLATQYDEASQRLIYDRKLKEGSGSSIYGLEVAKSMFLDPDFIKLANEIRKRVAEIPEMILSTKKSRYNSEVYVDGCFICSSKDHLHTHHIREQHTADKDGFIGDIPKDAKFNLMVLCGECHRRLHQEHWEVVDKQVAGGMVRLVTP